jgi:two-component system, OmpR family, response regulator
MPHFTPLSNGAFSGEAVMLEDLCILVVDNDPDSRELLKFVFEQQAAEAIELIKQFRPTVLLSELALPEEDGYTLMHKVQALAEQQLSPLLAIAAIGYACAEDRLSALQAGFHAHFAKPLDLDRLVSFVVDTMTVKAS